ncbi:hypothetical protein RB213_013445 [Colletotrichum asianum]
MAELLCCCPLPQNLDPDFNRITTRTGTTHARHHAITNRSLEANLEPAPAPCARPFYRNRRQAHH